MRVEQIDRLETFAAHLGVEVNAAGFEAAIFEHAEHGVGREVDVGRKLVGVPAEELIAGVGVDRSQRTRGTGNFELMLHRVTGERGVVGLDVELEVRQQAVLAQEVKTGGGVGIILMLGRLLGLGLDVELSLEADLLFVLHCHAQKRREMLLLALHFGVEQGLVPFAATPEGIALATKFVRHLHRLLHLRAGMGKHLGVAGSRGAMRVARMRKQVGCSPQQLDAGALLFFLEHLGDGIEVAVRFGKVATFRRNVAVVPAVIRCAKFFDELKGHAHALLGILETLGAVIPRTLHRRSTKGVAAIATEGVPIHDGETQMLAHRATFDDLFRIVVLEGQRILRGRSFVCDALDAWECGFHMMNCWGDRPHTRKRASLTATMML